MGFPKDITWFSELGTGQIIILSVYAIGYLIIFIFQHRKINDLKEKFEGVKDLVELVKSYKDLYTPQQLEYFKNLAFETAQMERDKAIQKIEAERTKGTAYLLEEYKATMDTLTTLMFRFPYLPLVNETINEMKDSATKEALLRGLKRIRDILAKEGIDETKWISNYTMGLQMKSFMDKKKSLPSSQQKQKEATQ